MISQKLVRHILVFAMALAVITAYPHGAPDSACPTLNPVSHGKSTATEPSPFGLIFSSSTYTSDELITVNLAGGLFKGYLIVARKADGSSTDPVGYFQNLSVESRVACTNATTGNGVTQTNNTVKNSATFTWRAPSTEVGDIVFHFTVVRGEAPSTKVEKSDYYMDQKSGVLRPTQAGAAKPKFQQQQGGPKFLKFMTIDEEKVKDTWNVPALEKLIRGNAGVVYI